MTQPKPLLAKLTSALSVRSATTADLGAITAFDERSNHATSPDYWREMFHRYGGDSDDQLFLVCASGTDIIGFIIGEIRDWEFDSPPCGWVFALGVRPDMRLCGIATLMFEEMCAFFRSAGIERVRTMVARDNNDFHSFFRSQGMMAGPYVQLEKPI